jgi:hypothetical protein
VARPEEASLSEFQIDSEIPCSSVELKRRLSPCNPVNGKLHFSLFASPAFSEVQQLLFRSIPLYQVFVLSLPLLPLVLHIPRGSQITQGRGIPGPRRPQAEQTQTWQYGVKSH